MTITQVISRNEKNMEALEGLHNFPKEALNDIDAKYNEINEMLEEVLDEYGDEDESGNDDLDEDTW